MTNTTQSEKAPILPEEETSETKEASLSQRIRGVIAEFGIVLFTVMSTSSIQLLRREIPDLELNAFRFTSALVFACVAILITRRWPIIQRSEIVSTCCLGLISFTNSITLFIAVTLIPLSTAQSINMTSGITSGIILLAIFTDERITLKNIAFALLCICGVVMVIQPDLIFPGGQNTEKISMDISVGNETISAASNNEEEASMLKILLGYSLPIVTGVGVSATIVLNKRHPYMMQHVIEVLFWVFLIGTVLSLVAMAIFEHPVLPGSWYSFFLVSIHCLAFVAGWPLRLYAVERISGNTVNIICSTSVVFMLISQYTVLSSIHPGHRNWIEVVGVVLVLVGSTLGSLVEMCKK